MSGFLKEQSASDPQWKMLWEKAISALGNTGCLKGGREQLPTVQILKNHVLKEGDENLIRDEKSYKQLKERGLIKEENPKLRDFADYVSEFVDLRIEGKKSSPNNLFENSELCELMHEASLQYAQALHLKKIVQLGRHRIAYQECGARNLDGLMREKQNHHARLITQQLLDAQTGRVSVKLERMAATDSKLKDPENRLLALGSIIASAIMATDYAVDRMNIHLPAGQRVKFCEQDLAIRPEYVNFSPEQRSVAYVRKQNSREIAENNQGICLTHQEIIKLQSEKANCAERL